MYGREATAPRPASWIPAKILFTVGSMTNRIAGSWLVLATLAATLFMSCATAGGTCLNTVTCCIEAHPGNPEACGLTASIRGRHIGCRSGGYSHHERR